ATKMKTDSTVSSAWPSVKSAISMKRFLPSVDMRGATYTGGPPESKPCPAVSAAIIPLGISPGRAPGGPSGSRNGEERHRGEMNGRGGDHQQVEDLVVAEGARAGVGPLQRVDQRAQPVQQPARRDQHAGDDAGLDDDRREPHG